jgi:hypothetical protein
MLEQMQKDQVLKDAKNIGGVQYAYVFYGIYDMVMKAKADSMEQLKELVTHRLRTISGKIKTKLPLRAITIPSIFFLTPYSCMFKFKKYRRMSTHLFSKKRSVARTSSPPNTRLHFLLWRQVAYSIQELQQFHFQFSQLQSILEARRHEYPLTGNLCQTP